MVQPNMLLPKMLIHHSPSPIDSHNQPTNYRFGESKVMALNSGGVSTFDEGDYRFVKLDVATAMVCEAESGPAEAGLKGC